MRDYRRALSLDFSLIAEAQKYYTARGFTETPVPWVVGESAYSATLPPDVKPYATLGGFLVASAEQAFLHLMQEGAELGRAQATSPCFRDEAHDELHSPYFLKTELIVAGETDDGVVREVLGSARKFFERYLPVEVKSFADGTYDLVCARSGIELGSYGARTSGAHEWTYGTGLALPRLSQAIEIARGARG